MKKFNLALTAFLVPLDLIGILLSTAIAINLRSSVEILPLDQNRVTSIGFTFLWLYFPMLLAFFAAHQLYVLSEIRHRAQTLFRIISANAAASMVLFMIVLVGRTPFVVTRIPLLSEWAYGTSLLTIFYLWTSSTIILTALRWLYRGVLNGMFGQGIGCRRVLLVGDTEVAETILSAMKSDTTLGYSSVGIVQTSHGTPQMQCIGDMSQIEEIIRRARPDLIIEVDPELPYDIVLNVIDAANDAHIDFSFAPNLFEVLATNVTISNVDGIPILNLRRTPLDGWGKILKRATDIIISLFGIIILSPILVLVALLVKLQDNGPILFGHARVSQGSTFTMYKFRSMQVNAEALEDKLRAEANEREDGPLFKMKNDPRVTPFGKFMRKSRLDELPQLFNVLRGDMSLIGPRPHLPKEVAQYQKHHRKVLAIKAGMTGLAQLAGSSDLSFEEEVRLDTYYVENWSLLKDIEILLKTPFIIIFKDRSGV